MNFEEYKRINTDVSSEMFYSIMELLHDKLPCSKHILKSQEQFNMQNDQKLKKVLTPRSRIAAPSLLKGILNCEQK